MTEDAIESAKLSLYAFQLSHDMESGEWQRTRDSQDLWETIAQLGKDLHIPVLPKLSTFLNLEENLPETAKFQPLLSDEIDNCLRLPFPNSDLNPPFLDRKIDLYAAQIHDTYVVDLTIHHFKPVTIEHLSYLNPDGKLLAHKMQASLGQTLVLFVKPQNNPAPEEYRDLSDRSLETLLSSANFNLEYPSYLNEGKLLGSPIFEYDNFAKDPSQSCHILIWLCVSPETLSLEARVDDDSYYYPLIEVLCYRSKIVFSYWQACDRYREARKIYQELDQRSRDLTNLPVDREKRLDNLKKSLVEMNPQDFTYASYIRDIEDHLTSIKTNLHNYIKSLQVLEQVPGENDLTNFRDFRKTSNYYVLQMKTYLNYLMPGKELFGHCIATMRGIVEIEQAEINNKRQQQETDLQHEIQAIGIGITVGTTFAASSGLMTQSWEWGKQKKIESFTQLFHPFWMVVFGSLGMAIAAFFLFRYLLKRKRKRSRKIRRSHLP